MIVDTTSHGHLLIRSVTTRSNNVFQTPTNRNYQVLLYLRHSRSAILPRLLSVLNLEPHPDNTVISCVVSCIIKLSSPVRPCDLYLIHGEMCRKGDQVNHVPERQESECFQAKKEFSGVEGRPYCFQLEDTRMKSNMASSIHDAVGCVLEGRRITVD